MVQSILLGCPGASNHAVKAALHITAWTVRHLIFPHLADRCGCSLIPMQPSGLWSILRSALLATVLRRAGGVEVCVTDGEFARRILSVVYAYSFGFLARVSLIRYLLGSVITAFVFLRRLPCAQWQGGPFSCKARPLSRRAPHSSRASIETQLHSSERRALLLISTGWLSIGTTNAPCDFPICLLLLLHNMNSS